MSYNDRCNIDKMLGKTLLAIENNDDQVVFMCDDGKFIMEHQQDCCESVRLEDVIGDLEDLVGSPLLEAEEVIGETPDDWSAPEWSESYTWTFYKLGTRKGSVTLRWLGESNGYYSERVNVEFIPRAM